MLSVAQVLETVLIGSTGIVGERFFKKLLDQINGRRDGTYNNYRRQLYRNVLTNKIGGENVFHR
jgi:hypothetical protein